MNLSLLKKLIPNNLKNILKDKLGVPSQEKSLKLLKSLGFHPNIVLDIGAYEGNWTKFCKDLFPTSSILMVEGQNSKKSILAKVCKFNKGIDYKIALLGANDAMIDFYIYDTASSILKENNITGASIEPRQLSLLDDLLEGTIFNNPDLIKLDTQGSELEVLKGGEKTLNYDNAVLMEVSLLDIYKEAPLVSDVIKYMSDRDFVLYDICSLMKRPLDRALYQGDFLFVKTNSLFRSDKRWV